MKNLYKHNIANRGIAVFSGVLIPISLILSIPVFFKSELAKQEEKPPIVLEMMALQLPQQQPIKPVEKVKPKPKPKPVKKQNPVKPKVVKKKPEPKPSKKKTPKKTMIAKAKPEVKDIPQPVEKPVEKSIEKLVEKVIEEVPKEVVVQQETAPALPAPVPIFKLTEAPQFLHREDLIYPEAMRASGVTGVVKLAVLIGKEGNVHRVTVLKSAGKAFDEAAKRALLASTFIPAKVGNEMVAVELRMPVKFRLM